MSGMSRRGFLVSALGVGAGVGGAAAIGRGRRDPLEGTGAAVKERGGGDLHVVRRSCFALGSQVAITVLDESPPAAERAIAAAMAELRVVERLMSIYRPDSQLSRLNRNGVLERPHPYVADVLCRARQMSQRSEGAFDVTVQPLWDVYADAHRAGGLPDAAALDHARRKVDWRRLEVSGGRIRLHGPGTAVTLNGIAQGFAADRVRGALARARIRYALVDTGEIGTLGGKAAEGPWQVGIQHPRREDAYVALANLDGRCLATSGDYASSFTADHRHHHLFDPKTGRSAERLASVSVAARTATEADALSTSVFVLGPERGLHLVRTTPGADALFVLKDGRTVATEGFPQVA